MAWLAPMAFLMVGAVAVAGILSHWRAEHTAGAPDTGEIPPVNLPSGDAGPAADAPAEPDRYRDIVERELGAFDD